jgi:competence protein ComEC
LSGAASSVVRAEIFSLLILFGKTLGRRDDFTNIMLLAAIIMVLVNPFVLYNDIGFQLSFLAFCGLIYLSPIIEKYIESKKFLSKMPDWLKTTLTATLGAQIAVFPLILVVFGRVSLIAPLSNVLVLWIVPWAMGLVAITGLLTIVWYPLGKSASFFAWPALQFIIIMVERMARIPGASFTWSTNSWLVLPVCYTILIVATFFLYRKYKLSI